MDRGEGGRKGKWGGRHRPGWQHGDPEDQALYSTRTEFHSIITECLLQRNSPPTLI